MTSCEALGWTLALFKATERLIQGVRMDGGGSLVNRRKPRVANRDKLRHILDRYKQCSTTEHGWMEMSKHLGTRRSLLDSVALARAQGVEGVTK